MSILTRVQSNPEIGTDDSAFVSEVVTRAKNFVRAYCNLPVFPELAQGYAQSRAGVSTDITGLSTASFYIRVNGSPEATITLDLSACDSGANIATEMQAKIRAVDNTDYGFDEVTVSFDASATQYTLTSGRYGEHSSVVPTFDETQKSVCEALGLSPAYGGVACVGAVDDEDLISATVELVEQFYRRVGVEGMQNFALHQGEFNAAVYDYASPSTMHVLKSRRRLW